MSSLSPEPLIDLKEDDTFSITSNSSGGSDGSGRRRPPPPPPPSNTKPKLVRSLTADSVRKGPPPALPHRASQRIPPSIPLPAPPSKPPPLPPAAVKTSVPLPPPKPMKSLGRTISSPVKQSVGVTYSPNLSKVHETPSSSNHQENADSPVSPPPPSHNTFNSTDKHYNDSSSPDNHVGVPEGRLISLESPPPIPSPPPTQSHVLPTIPSSGHNSNHHHRAQPISLPKPANSRELEYEEKEHPRNAFKILEKFRNKKDLCDCVLIAGDIEIQAHRVVLASCSSYFESMFIGEFAEPEDIPIVIEEVDELALKSLIDFAYTSRITLSHSNVYTLFEAADVLDFQGIKNACFRFFKSQMNKSNCIRTWMFAESHNCTELLDASLKFIEVNFLNIVRGREFLAVECDTACRLLELENIAITSEEQVYEASIGWINHDLNQRKKYAFKIFQKVRFSSMNRDYLMHISDNEPIIRDDEDCLQLIIGAIESHMSSIRATLKRNMKKDNNNRHLLPRAAAMAVEDVELFKYNGSLGVGIMGGSDRPTHVFRQGDKPGIFIRDVMSGGAAERSGKIRMGDRILSINGTDVSNSTHDQAIKLLLVSPDPLKLLIRHEPPPPGLQELTLVAKPGEGFGFSFVGGVNGDPGNPYDDTDEGIFISQIISGGAAEKDGRLSEGMRILQINSVSLLDKTHDECVKVLQGTLDRLKLLVCHGYTRTSTPSGASVDMETIEI